MEMWGLELPTVWVVGQASGWAGEGRELGSQRQSLSGRRGGWVPNGWWLGLGGGRPTPFLDSAPLIDGDPGVGGSDQRRGLAID